MSRLFISCDEAARRVSRAQDVPLTVSERLGLLLHLAACRWCRRYREQVRFLRPAFRELLHHLEEACEERLSDPARARIVERLRAKGWNPAEPDA